MQDTAELRDGPCFALVTPAPLSTDALVAAVADEGAGAIATFTGVTRNSFQGKPTEKLEYEAYVPMAAKKLLVRAGRGRRQAHGQGRAVLGATPAASHCLCFAASVPLAAHGVALLQELCREARTRWQLCKVAIAHRTGTVLVGEASVVIACSSAHRADALEASGGEEVGFGVCWVLIGVTWKVAACRSAPPVRCAEGSSCCLPVAGGSQRCMVCWAG